METAIRFSQNSFPGEGDQRFLKVDVINKIFQLCKITKESRTFAQYDTIYTSTKVPAFRAFDWHPVEESLIAVGGAVGDATLVNIADGQQDPVLFSARSQRTCNAVALSAQNLIAVGLDRVRTDFCLNIWDFTQRSTPSSASRSFPKSHSDPLHRLAGGESITSLKFYNGDPRLLVAGVKGQYVRLYDLREQSNNQVLQFATKCVSNLAIDPLDDNYVASCYASHEPLVCIWDRRMAARADSSPVSFYQSSMSPGVSLELANVADHPDTVWSLRFSKSRRGCLGVLSNSGNLKVFEIGKDFMSEDYDSKPAEYDERHHRNHYPEDIYLRRIHDIERAADAGSEQAMKQRIVSFDFMTSYTSAGQPKIVQLTGDDSLRITVMPIDPEPIAISAVDFICKGATFISAPVIDKPVAVAVDKLRRSAEPKNALKQAFKISKQGKASSKEHLPDLRRMSSFANHSWNADLGYYEKTVSIDDLLLLLAAPRLRCEAGYLLDPAKNRSIVADSQWVEAFWSWIERAERISRNRAMIQDNLDLSFVGVYSIWMEEISTSLRQTGASFSSISAVIKSLASRLKLPLKRGLHTEYPSHRKLCLYISGLAWSVEELDTVVQRLIASGQHTKAAATAIFADEEKLAYKALRAKSATQSHKMLAMAVAGARRRKLNVDSGTSSRSPSDSETDEDDWAQTISALSADLIDPYARAILAYVKSGSWSDVVSEEALPLKQRLGVALRHLSDADLTTFIGRMTRQVISSGDIEGIILTGTGTREGLELLQAFAGKFNDLQTVVLGMSVGGAARRFMGNTEDDKSHVRRLDAMREAYRSMMMSWALKFDRVRFDIAYSGALNHSPTQGNSGDTSSGGLNRIIPKPKEQIRLVCTYCTQSLTQFPGETGIDTGQNVQYTTKNPLAPEKAAVLGTVCPKCGRHLPRCGVCDLWLGVPDETYAKYWHTSTMSGKHVNNTQKHTANNSTASRNISIGGNSADHNMTASMTASIVTTIGPSTTNNTLSSKFSKPTVSSQGTKTRSSHPTNAGDAMQEQRPQQQQQPQGADAEAANLQQDLDDLRAKDNKWAEVMHKFTVFCVRCSHGFHAEHARLWFDGSGGGGREGHRICPVPECGCACNG